MEKEKKAFNYGWVLVAILLFGSVVNYLDRVNLSVANTTIAKEFGLNAITMGLLLSAFQWPYAFANLPAGWLADKIGPKKVFTFAISLWSVVTILAGCAVGFKSLYAARVMLGIAEAPFFICGAKVSQDWFNDRERGLATSIFNDGNQVANAIAPPLLTAVLLTFGWRPMFMSLGVLGILVVLLWVKFYKKNPNSVDDAGTEKPKATNQVSAKSMLKLFRYPSTWKMMIGDFGITYVIWVFLTWLPTYLTTSRHLSLMKAGWTASIPYIAGMFAVPIGGLISDLLIRKMHLPPITSRKIPIIIGGVVAAVAVAPVAYVRSITLCIVLMTVGFFASSLAPGIVWTLVTDVAPKELAGSLGAIQNFAAFIGGACAPIITGIILKATGTFQLVFVVAAVICLIAAISYGTLDKKIELEAA